MLVVEDRHDSPGLAKRLGDPIEEPATRIHRLPGVLGFRIVPVLAVCTINTVRPSAPQEDKAPAQAEEAEGLKIEYLEIVTPDVEAMCELFGAVHGVTFGEPIAAFGNARTTQLAGGGRIGIRAPMRPDEAPVVRPYLRVEDINAAAEEAGAAGGQIAIPPMAIPGEMTFSIFLMGGIEHGLWAD